MKPYAKFWAALFIGAAFDVLTAIQVALDGGITTSEWITVALVLLGTVGTALGVYTVPNED